MPPPVRQGLGILREPPPGRSRALQPVFEPVALHRPAVDMQNAARYPDPVSREADDAFDVVGRTVRRRLEDDDVTRLRLRGQKPAGDQRDTEGK